MRDQRMVEIREGLRRARTARRRGAAPRRDLLTRLAAWHAEPVERAFRRLGDQAVGLARRFGKPDLRVVVEADELRLDRARFAPLFGELIHVIRNAVDHGIERPEERVEQGKPAAGTLVLRA